MLRRLLILLRHPRALQTQGDVYRSPPDENRAAILMGLEQHISNLQRRAHVLEQALQLHGIPEPPTPTAKQLLIVADYLDAQSRLSDSGPTLNTLELAHLASLLRSWATWVKDEPTD